MVIHLFNKSCMYLLMAYHTFSSNKAILAHHFVFHSYVETVFQDIMPDTNIAKVSIAR